MRIIVDWENHRIYKDSEFADKMETEGDIYSFDEWLDEEYTPSSIFDLFDTGDFTADKVISDLREDYEEYRRSAIDEALYYCGVYDIEGGKINRQN